MFKRQILITGSAGFIGFHLSKNLTSRGYKVTGIDNINDYYDINLKLSRLKILKKNINYSHANFDLKNYNRLNKLISKLKPEFVIHLAAQAGVRYSLENPKAYIENNINCFFNILDVCKNNKVSNFIYASSSSVYGNKNLNKFKESNSTDNPMSLYAATKKTNEIIAKSYENIYRINTTGLRFFTVYGPYGRPDMSLFKFTKQIIENKEIEVFNNGKHIRDFTYIDDIVDGITKLLSKIYKSSNKKKFNKIYNLGNGNPQSLNEYIKIIEKELSKKSKKKYLKLQIGDVYKTSANISQAKKDFGYSPKISIKYGIPQFINWYKNYYGY